MTLGEQLLNLTVEYKASKESHEDGWPSMPGTPVGRRPEIIASEYEATLRELLAGEVER